MKRSLRMTIASMLSFLLMFSVPAPALAALSVAEETSDSASIEVKSYEAEDNLRWFYELHDGNVFIVGCEAFLPPAPVVPEQPDNPDAPENPDGQGNSQGGEGAGGGDSQGSTDTSNQQNSSDDGSTETSNGSSSAPLATSGDDNQGTTGESSESSDANADGEGGASSKGETTGDSADSTVTADEPQELVQPVEIGIPSTIVDSSGQTRSVYGVAARSDQDENSWATFISIAIPSSVRVIDDGAFSGCAKLETISFSSNSKLETIGSGAFEQSGITQLTLPGSIASIGEYAFSSCDSLKRVAFAAQPASIEIETGAFAECANLTSVEIPEALMNVSGSLFYKCSKLSSVTLPSGLASIGEMSFAESGITSVSIPASVKTIDANVFEKCAQLKSVTYDAASAVTVIAANTFNACSSLEKVTLPSGLTTIGDSAFRDCAALSSIDVSACAKLAYIEQYAFLKAGLTSFNAPPSLKSIGIEAFRECPKLASVTFPTSEKSSLVKIEYYAFYKCTALREVVLPTTSNMPCISVGAFRETAITTIAIPDSVTQIFEQAFMDCTNLASITGGSKLKEIERNAFAKTKVVSLPESAYDTLRYFSGLAFKGSQTFVYDENALNGHGLYRQGEDYYRYDTLLSFSGTKSYKKALDLLKRVNEERAKAVASVETDATTSASSTSSTSEKQAVVSTGETQANPSTASESSASSAEDSSSEPSSTPEALVMDEELCEAAMVRATELPVYFSDEIRPTGLPASTASSKATKELDVAGVSSVTGVLNTLKSSGKEASLYEAGYRSIGIGCFMQNGIYYWAILLGTEESDAASTKSGDVAASVEVGLRNEATDYWPYLEIAPVSEGTNMKAGQSTQLILKCHARNNPRHSARLDVPSSVVFSSATPTVASVNQRTGLVTFSAGGQAEIYASLLGIDFESHPDMIASYTFNVAARDSVENADVTGISKATYTGKAITQKPVVVLGGKTLSEGTDYTVSYENNVNAGTATAIISGIGQYDGKVSKTFTIAKAKQKLSVKKVAKTIKTTKRTFAAFTLSGSQGKVTCQNVSKAKAAKKFKAKKNGKVVAPKGTKRGSYKLSFKVSAAGNKNYKPASKTVKFTVRLV